MITLIRQRVRRDRAQLALWIVGTALLAGLTVVAVRQSYGSEADRVGVLATVAANPVILLFRGLPSGSDPAAFTLFLILPFLAMLAAFMSTFLAVRHTRAEEESGRGELVGATPASRTAPLVATLIHGLAANVLLAALVAFAFLGVGYAPGGAWVAGLAVGAAGVSFLGTGLIGGQLFRSSRAANSFGVWVLIAAFVCAGLGNAMGTPRADLERIDSSWLTWLSPFGWAENSRPFSDDNLWPVLLCAAFGLTLATIAIALQSARDLGASVVAGRTGRSSARPALASPTALVWRLTWPATVGWIAGGLVTGMLATTLAGVLKTSAEQLPSLATILDALTRDGSIEQGGVAIFFTMLGVIAACCGVQIVCRARQEEANGTSELVLTAPVARVRWLADYLVTAIAAIVLVAAAAVAGAALGLASTADADWTLMRDALVIGAGQVAAASVFPVITALVFVLAPRLTIPLGWTLVMLGMILGLFGALFGFPDWLVRLAPIGDAPTVTNDGVDLQGLWWLLLVVVAGSTAALALMRGREHATDG